MTTALSRVLATSVLTRTYRARFRAVALIRSERVRWRRPRAYGDAAEYRVQGVAAQSARREHRACRRSDERIRILLLTDFLPQAQVQGGESVDHRVD
jgi:hypothetical protein